MKTDRNKRKRQANNLNWLLTAAVARPGPALPRLPQQVPDSVGATQQGSGWPRRAVTTFARLAWADGRAYRGKVEGLAVRRTRGPGRLELLLVTDDDLGGSTALVADVRLGG